MHSFENLKIAVAGTGYVGLSLAVLLSLAVYVLMNLIFRIFVPLKAD